MMFKPPFFRRFGTCAHVIGAFRQPFNTTRLPVCPYEQLELKSHPADGQTTNCKLYEHFDQENFGTNDWNLHRDIHRPESFDRRTKLTSLQ
jgi:hypothetical protein